MSFSGEADLLQSVSPRHLAGASRIEPSIVIVVMIAPPTDLAAARGFLIVSVGQAVLPKSTVVKPIIAAPTVDHGH